MGIIMKFKEIKILIFVLLYLILAGSYSCFATALEITTGGEPGVHTLEGIVDESGNYLPNSVGNIVQVILISGESAGPPNSYGSPEVGDAIIGTVEVGYNFPFGPDGCFDTNVTADKKNKIICRVWNNADISLATFYGDSEIYTVWSDTTETWDIRGDADIPAFQTNLPFDAIPPGPPIDFIATTEASGDIFLTWTATIEPDAVKTKIVWSTVDYPTREGDPTKLCEVLTTEAQQWRHTGLANGTRYYYSAFSADRSGNFSVPANTSEVSTDTIPPSVIAVVPASDESGVSTSTDILVTFNDVMSTNETANSFSIYPVVGTTVSWQLGNTRMAVDAALSAATTYLCTVDTRARDDANNTMVTSFEWTFRTAAGLPPIVQDLRIDHAATFPGDIISSRPWVSAYITDPEYGRNGISTVEIWANSVHYTYSSPELNSLLDPLGNLDFRFLSNLPAGVYIITVDARDVDQNSSHESLAGLRVMAESNLLTPIYAYPNTFASGSGTTLAYKLTRAMDITIDIIGANGIAYTRSIPSGSPGARAGYNEVIWNGLAGNGEGLGTGVYIVKIRSGNEYFKERGILTIRNN